MGGYLVGQHFLCLMGNQTEKRVGARARGSGRKDKRNKKSEWINERNWQGSRDQPPLPPTQFPKCVVNFVFNKLNFLKKESQLCVFCVVAAFMNYHNRLYWWWACECGHVRACVRVCVRLREKRFDNVQHFMFHHFCLLISISIVLISIRMDMHSDFGFIERIIYLNKTHTHTHILTRISAIFYSLHISYYYGSLLKWVSHAREKKKFPSDVGVAGIEGKFTYFGQ